MPIHGYPGNIITANPTAPTVSSASGVWTTEQQLAAVAAGNWPTTIPTQQISRSLRFNSADSAYLNRTFGTPTDGKKYTYSGWVKRLDNNGLLLLCEQSNKIEYIQIGPSGTVAGTGSILSWRFGDASGPDVKTTAVYRDVSAWYHVVVVYDSTQATASNRIKLYVNGSQITDLTASYPSQNTNSSLNRNGADVRINSYTGTYIGNGYMTEVNFIDGQALTPSSFGQTNASTGVWEPIAYTGTYGTNGFFLNFSDNSGTTSTTLGKDYSGNGNNWTPNNFSVTAGAGNDSLVDTPTSYGTDTTGAGGEVRGNYATLNPLDNGGNTVSNGNLVVTVATGFDLIRSTMFLSSGKWYWEVTCDDCGEGFVGISSAAESLNQRGAETANSATIRTTNGDLRTNATNSAYGSSVADGNVMMFALDMDAGKFWAGKSGTWFNSGDPAAGTNAGKTGLTVAVSPSISVYDNEDYTANFGQRAFSYTAPSGFKALCTQNLPTPTIGATSTTQANDYFNAVLYTGTGSSNAQTGVGFQPDFVWIKGRSGATDHGLYDAVRGVQNQVESNTTTAETAEATGLTAFGTDGFTVGALAQLNTSAATYVAWNWNAGGSNATNTSGTITSTVRASTTAGFSIVTYTGTAANATVGHGLGVAPSFIMARRRDGVVNCYCYHSALAAGEIIQLNLTNAKASVPTAFNSGTPTSTTFPVGADSTTNASGGLQLAYAFAPVAGYSAFGSYTGNGSTDGPFVYLGFRPRYIMQKRTDSTGTWELYDTARDTYNVMSADLAANLSDAEYSIARFDALSNGFKIRTTGAATNASGGTYIYMAFAESPFKYSLAR